MPFRVLYGVLHPLYAIRHVVCADTRSSDAMSRTIIQIEGEDNPEWPFDGLNKP